jgi:hypothetical protein
VKGAVMARLIGGEEAPGRSAMHQTNTSSPFGVETVEKRVGFGLEIATAPDRGARIDVENRCR